MTLDLMLLVGLGVAPHLVLLVTLYLSTVVNLYLTPSEGEEKRTLYSIPLPPMVNLMTWKKIQTQ